MNLTHQEVESGTARRFAERVGWRINYEYTITESSIAGFSAPLAILMQGQPSIDAYISYNGKMLTEIRASDGGWKTTLVKQ